MNLSQKCQYAVRAVLELARRYRQGPVPAGEVAASQGIPQRFLEVILNELKPSGLVESRRGAQGGYSLSRDPRSITVGQVIRLIEGPLDPVRTEAGPPGGDLPWGTRALHELWDRAGRAVDSVYDSVTFHDLVDRERSLRRSVADYSI
ncbi:MAG: Rrf2 family transcriptional regulator [Planctomycetes bacterium]|nr:Rrf2 family transcriptional regulator [Planctomycetota bacterium]